MVITYVSLGTHQFNLWDIVGKLIVERGGRRMTITKNTEVDMKPWDLVTLGISIDLQAFRIRHVTLRIAHIMGGESTYIIHRIITKAGASIDNAAAIRSTLIGDDIRALYSDDVWWEQRLKIRRGLNA
jgi:hypothetical protein